MNKLSCVCVVMFAALAACSDDRTVVVMTAANEAPAYGATPFPTDGLRDGDHLAVMRGLDGIVDRHGDFIAAQLAALDGFGLRPLVEFPLTGALDAESVPATTSAIGDAAGLVDVDPVSGEHGRVIAMEWHYDDVRHVLQGRPMSGEILREGTRYAAFVTSKIIAAD